MLSVALALIFAAVPGPTAIHRPAVVMLTNPERASGFATMAACETALGSAARHGEKARLDRQPPRRGTIFNRQAGNLSRCEIVDGEALIVVYPPPYPSR